MGVPTIGAYSPPSTTASPTSQKPIIGGISYLFSSPTISRQHHTASSSLSFANGGDDLGCLWHERGEDHLTATPLFQLIGSYSSSSSSSSSSLNLKRDQSPVSVLQGPVSFKTSGGVSSRSPPTRIHNGFVRNAFQSSCIDYDSPSFQMQGGGLGVDLDSSSVIADELTFSLEDSIGRMETTHSESYAKDLLLGAQLRHKIFSEDFVVKAFYEAERAHRGQMRASGVPFLQHCVETGVQLALIGANSTIVSAGLLHDTLDDSFTSYDYILRTFGAGVAGLVQGVSKLSQLSKLARENNTANKTIEADRLHTMFLAMADARAVLIKLADRLHNMMTLDALPVAKQQRFAKETLEIFAPLANRLGISSWKDQLENLCFKHLYPDQHKELSSKLVKSFDEGMITTAIEKLDRTLKDGVISYHFLTGRHKSLYSIYSKMLKKKLSMDEIHDIHGLRLIVEIEEDCYKALRIVHQLWSQVPRKLKDYINHPKFNGYRSLHTVVLGEGMVPLEVQIRTKQMHLQAEFGIAAHWRYKENACTHSSFVLQMVEWARWVITWQCEAMSKYQSSIVGGDSIKPPCTFPSHSDACPYSYKPSCGHDGPIFVIMLENDKMSVEEFRANSTMMDLMERAGRGSSRWTPYRFPLKEDLRPRLNHKPVTDPTCKLQMGDVVELTPAIPDKSLTEYREEIQRMYDHGLTISATPPPLTARTAVGWRS